MVGLLALLNIALLVTIWQRLQHEGPAGGPPEGPGKRIIHDLGLNQKQQQKFEALKQTHRAAMERLRQRGGELRDEYFELLKNSLPDTSLVRQKARAIARNQEDIEMATFEHFREVRKICTPEQQKKFDAIITDVLRSMARPPRPPRERH